MFQKLTRCFNACPEKYCQLAHLRVNQLLELVTSQLSVQVLLLHQVIDADVGLSVTTKKFPCLLNRLIESQAAPWALPGVTAVLGSEFLAKLLHDLIVHITSTQIAIGAMADNTGLLLLEASNCDRRLRVAQIHKRHNPLLLFRQVILPEESVVVAYGRAFVDDAEALESGDVSGVNQRLSLGVRGVGRDGHDDVLGGHFVLLVELVQLAKVEGQDLLYGENVRVASLLNLKPNLVVGHRHNFMRREPLLNLKLSLALRVKSEEARREQDAVLEVALDLCLH